MSKRLVLVVVAVLTVGACGGAAESDSGDTPSAPAAPTSQAPERVGTPSATSSPTRPSATSSPNATSAPRSSAAGGATVAKPRVCYVPGKWKRYACTQAEFERNKVAVRKRLPKGDKRCLNGQPPQFYCAESSGRVAPSEG